MYRKWNQTGKCAFLGISECLLRRETTNLQAHSGEAYRSMGRRKSSPIDFIPMRKDAYPAAACRYRY
jgi:hypothetical protein